MPTAPAYVPGAPESGGGEGERHLLHRQQRRDAQLQPVPAGHDRLDPTDRALLDLAAFYRDVLAVQVGAGVELASSGHERDVQRLAGSSRPEDTVRRIEAIMACRERLELSVAPLLAVEEMTLALAAS